MPQPLLSIRDLTKSYGGVRVLDSISLDVASGEFVALLGPSGCGKTTLLRCIGGFVSPDSGTLSIDGIDMEGHPPYRRPVNTVFQNYALFPHLTVLENVAYGPRRHGRPAATARKEAGDALGLVGLESFATRLPAQLSGGQQQRAALARAIVNRPKLLLLDEPLSALDLKLRKRMQIELKQLQHRLGIAFVFVTHDQDEALTLADRIVAMNAGRIEQVGTGEALYRSPATRFVADFVGEANLIECEVDAAGMLRPRLGSVALPLGDLDPRRRYLAVLRPENIDWVDDSARAGNSGFATFAGVVEDMVRAGSYTRVRIRVGDAVIAMQYTGARRLALAPGETATFGYHVAHLHLIAE